MRSVFVIILGLTLLLPLVWSLLTSPALTEKPVRIEFEWNKHSGFTYVRSVAGLGRVFDPPYDEYFTNPIVTGQSKQLILSLIKNGESANRRNYTMVKGQLDVWVCCLGFVRGVDTMSETSYMKPE